MEEKIKELEKQIAELKRELEKKTEMEQGRSEFGKPYYYIGVNGKAIYWSRECGVDYDNDFYEFGNYFKSEEEAKKIAKKIKAITKVTRAINKANNGWKPDWNNPRQDKLQIALNSNKKLKAITNEKIVWACDNIVLVDCKQALLIPYIKDLKQAEKIIKEYEKELKIIFDIEE